MNKPIIYFAGKKKDFFKWLSDLANDCVHSWDTSLGDIRRWKEGLENVQIERK